MGDSAATIDLGNAINELLNDKVIAMQQWLLAHHFPGQKDIIAAYSSLTIIYDPVAARLHFQNGSSVFEKVRQHLQTAFNESAVQTVNSAVSDQPGRQQAIIRIPVCYEEEYAMDLPAMAAEKNMSTEEIIALHTGAVYRVYTIGFLPGFSYMAAVHEKLITPRKLKPVPVQAGSVGIAGAQTGIYPLNSPGGWHIIGRTPIKQFDAHDKDLVKLKVGDNVQFYRISKKEMLIGWLNEGLIS
jgi:inhibitor of KinA